METSQLISHMKSCLNEIPQLKEIREGFHNPHVKAWKTKLEDLLANGGSACEKTLVSLKKIKNEFSGSEFIKLHTYINQLDALERNLKQCIQTIQVFGRPEDNDVLPHWGKPKSQQRAVGHLMVGEEEVATDTITIHEVLDCLVSLSEDTDHLTEEMSEMLVSHLQAILNNELLQPFLSQKLDALLGHWPEFQTK